VEKLLYIIDKIGAIFMKFNKKFFNWSAWITLIIAYVLPYQSTDGFATNFGYPFAFLTVHKTSITTSLLMTETLNILLLALNILIVYFVISFANVQFIKVKSGRDRNKPKNYK
jgi:hypothetical protein